MKFVSDQTDASPLIRSRIGGPHPQRCKRLIQRFIADTFINRRLDLLSQYVDDNIIVHTPYYSSRLRGFAAYHRFLEEFNQAFPNATAVVDDIIAGKDRVAVRWYVKGRYVGDFMHIPTSNRQITLHIMCFYHIVDNKITEIWTVDTGFWLSSDF